MINFNLIEDNIFIGSAPQNKVDVERIKQLKVTAILSLQSDADFKQHRIDWALLQNLYEQNDIAVQRFPIQDFNEQDLGKKVGQPIQALKQLLDVKHRVYVHCNAGVCRASATVLGYLCVYRGMTFDEGLAYLRAKRPQVNPYKKAVELAVDELKNQR